MAKRAKKRNAWGPFGTRETYRVTRAPGRANEHSYKGYKVWQTWPEGFKTSADPESTFDTLKDVKRFIDWQKKNPGKPGSAFKRCVAAVSEKGGAGDPRAVCAAAGRKKYGAKKYAAMAQAGKKRAARGNPVPRYQKRGRARNPADAAAEVYEEFHGRPSSEVVTVTEKIHYHKNLAALGELRTLIVQARDGERVTLTRFKRAILCTNEAKNQLFVRGGDQSVDLKVFEIRTSHEIETLGKVVELAYFTTKDHLGDEGGTAVYFHVSGRDERKRQAENGGVGAGFDLPHDRRTPGVLGRLLYDSRGGR